MEGKMAEKKKDKQGNTCSVIEKDGKYFCSSCQTEVKAQRGDDYYCPGCRARVDWTEKYFDAHHSYP
jgi:Zn finger protein HypA/HybF involved in hydrogenase expression